MKLYTTLLCALTSASVLAAPAAEAAPAELAPRSGEYLGGIDVNAACWHDYGRDFYAYSTGNSCNDWKCVYIDDSLGGRYGMDMPAQCARQYGGGVYAWCTTGVNGWGCYRS
jgi:hypothetical protein